MANTNANLSASKLVTFGAAKRIALANLAITAAEALASRKLDNDKRLVAKLNHHGYVEFDLVVKPATKKHPAVTKTLTLDAEIIAAALHTPKGSKKAHGVVFAKANLRKVSKKEMALLVSNRVLMPPTKDGANVQILS